MKVDVAPASRRGGPLVDTAPPRRTWNVPDRSVLLAGHWQLLKAVHRTLRSGRRALLCPAEARAGTGATTAMVEFAHRHARDYDVAWCTPDGVALHRVPAALLIARTAGEHLGDRPANWAASRSVCSAPPCPRTPRTRRPGRRGGGCCRSCWRPPTPRAASIRQP